MDNREKNIDTALKITKSEFDRQMYRVSGHLMGKTQNLSMVLTIIFTGVVLSPKDLFHEAIVIFVIFLSLIALFFCLLILKNRGFEVIKYLPALKEEELETTSKEYSLNFAVTYSKAIEKNKEIINFMYKCFDVAVISLIIICFSLVISLGIKNFGGLMCGDNGDGVEKIEPSENPKPAETLKPNEEKPREGFGTQTEQNGIKKPAVERKGFGTQTIPLSENGKKR